MVLTAIVFSFIPPTGKTYKINVRPIEVRVIADIKCKISVE